MPSQVESVALGFRDAQAALAATAAAALGKQWAKVDPANVMASWTAQLPQATLVLSGAQTVAAQQVGPYLDDESVAQGGEGLADLEVVPEAFAGVASDGRALTGLLQQAGWAVMTSLGSGAPIDRAMAGGAATLDMIARTQVADAGRAATQVGIAGRHEFSGFIRIASAGACARCAILAGKFYRYNGSFPRHPRCHCSCAPASERTLGKLRQSPHALYEAMTTRERQLAGWSLADQRAIEHGADLFQVTNAHRGLSSLEVAGRRVQTTTVGAGRARVRLTPQSVFDESDRLGWSRAETITQLHRHGYLTGDLDAALAKLAPKVDRATLGKAAAKSSGEGVGAVPRARTEVMIRERLQSATTAGQVAKVFTTEAERLTGRTIPAEFRGSVATAREHAEGLLRGLERFPEADLTRVESALFTDSSYAEAENGVIRFNQAWTTGPARQKYLDTLSNDVLFRWHPAGMDNPAGIALHEFGHIVDLETIGEVARPAIDRLVADAAVADEVTAEELIKFDISRYAATSGDELAAEAFADVMLNGDAASQLSRDIYAELRTSYEAGGRVFTATERVRSAAATDELNTTVANLRAMAADRDIKIPAGARKADIQALLRDAGKTPTSPKPTVSNALADLRPAARKRLSDVLLGANDKGEVFAATEDLERLEARGLVRREVGSFGEVIAGRAQVVPTRFLITDEGRAAVGKTVTPELSPLKLAQARQADIDVARGVANMVADLRPRIADGAEPDVLRHRIEAAARKGVIDAKTRTQMLAAVNDPAKLDRLVQAQARKAGLKPIGAPGKSVTYDPALHKPIGGSPKAGVKVQVVSPGFQLTRAGEIIRLSKADVMVVETPLERQTLAQLRVSAADKGIPVRATDKKADLQALLRGTYSTEEKVLSGDLRGLKQVGEQLGGNPGGTFEASDGTRWYVKTATSEEQARNEALALALYRAAGIEAPEMVVGSGAALSDGVQVATKILPNAKVDLLKRLTDDAYIAEIRQGFAVDAWLANWDVVGANPAGGWDNIVSVAGKPVRIEAGGALRYRGLGGLKGAKFADSVGEWDTLRTADRAGKLFGGITPEQLAESVARVQAISPTRIRALVKEAGLDSKLADTLVARRADLIARLDRMQAGGGKQEFDRLLPAAKKGVNALRVPALALDDSGLTLEGLPNDRAALEALRAYRGSSYRPINMLLRGSGHKGDAYYEGLVKDMDRAMAASPLSSDVVGYRGLATGRGIFGADRATWGDLTGRTWVEGGFGSISTRKAAATEFAGAWGGRGGVMMRIVVPKGVDGIKLSSGAASGESEILLDRGLTFRVVADHGDVNGVRQLDVIVVPRQGPPKAL